MWGGTRQLPHASPPKGGVPACQPCRWGGGKVPARPPCRTKPTPLHPPPASRGFLAFRQFCHCCRRRLGVIPRVHRMQPCDGNTYDTNHIAESSHGVRKRPPLGSTTRPYAQAYCRVLGECVFLQVRYPWSRKYIVTRAPSEPHPAFGWELEPFVAFGSISGNVPWGKY